MPRRFLSCTEIRKHGHYVGNQGVGDRDFADADDVPSVLGWYLDRSVNDNFITKIVAALAEADNTVQAPNGGQLILHV